MARRDYLITTVQKRWRGLICRRIVVFFRTELVRLRNWIFSRVLKLQRIYRGHAARLYVRKFRAQIIAEKALNKYKITTKYKKLENNRKYSSLILKSKYSHEREIEFTARSISRLEDCDLDTEWKGKRFACFDASTYADIKVKHQIDTHIAIESEYQNLKNNEIIDENNRKKFINLKIAEIGPKHYGYRTMKPNEVTLIKEAELKAAIEASVTEEHIVRELAESELFQLSNEIEYEEINEQQRKKLIDDKLQQFSSSSTTTKLKEALEKGKFYI